MSSDIKWLRTGLIIVGVLLCLEAMYMPAKAMLAQHLLQRALPLSWLMSPLHRWTANPASG